LGIEITVHLLAHYPSTIEFVDKSIESVAGYPGTLRNMEEWMY
jgi:hypothetical protein